MRQIFLAALSFANLCYLRVWSELLTYRRWDTYLMTAPPKPVEYYALMVNVLLAAVLLTVMTVLVTRVLTGGPNKSGSGQAGRPVLDVAEMVLVAAVVLPLNAIRSVLSVQYPVLKSGLIETLGIRGAVVLGALLAAAGLTLVVRYHRKASQMVVTVLVALSPFCVVTFGQGFYKASKYDDTEYRNKPPAARLPVTPGAPRVVWVIADEWDYRLTFVNREASLRLPEIDRLRAGSLSGGDVWPPGPETPISIPGYYDGKLVNYIDHPGPRELMVRFHGEDHNVPWSTQTSVFDRAHTLGANTALLDWYHPTCRVLNNLTYCHWWPLAMQHNSMGEGFWQVLPNQTRSLGETNILSLFGRTLTADQHAGVYREMMAEAKKLLADPQYGFVLVHLPVPHAPHSYDRKTGTFTLGNKPYQGYWDSMALLDLTVGELRRAMEAARLWDTTTVLFTSDHSYRDSVQLDGKSDYRIPYLLKLAGQKESAEYGKQFNSVLTEDLLMDVMQGKVRDAAAAGEWLDRNRTRPLRGETPSSAAQTADGGTRP